MKSIINNSRDIKNAIYDLEKEMNSVNTHCSRLRSAKASICHPTDNQLLTWDEDLHMIIDSLWQLPAADGAVNEILYTDGAGNLGWVAPGAAAVAGADTQIQYNLGGVMGAEAAFTYNYNTNTMTVDSARATVDSSPNVADGATLGTADLEWSDAYFADSSVIYFGDDQDVTLTHIPDTGLLLNLELIVGLAGPGSIDPAIVIHRNATAATNGHGFVDETTVNKAGDIGYASYDANITITGTEQYDHFNNYQARGNYTSTGILDEYRGYRSIPAIDAGAGTVGNVYHFEAEDYSGGGTVTNQYGLYIHDLTNATNNYSIYTGTALSYFGGNIRCQGVFSIQSAPVAWNPINVDFTTTDTTASNHIGFDCEYTWQPGANVAGSNGYGMNFWYRQGGTGDINEMYGVNVRATLYQGSGDVLSHFTGLRIAPSAQDSTADVGGNFYGIYLQPQLLAGVAVDVANDGYQLRLDDYSTTFTIAGDSWGIRQIGSSLINDFDGELRISTANKALSLGASQEFQMYYTGNYGWFKLSSGSGIFYFDTYADMESDCTIRLRAGESKDAILELWCDEGDNTNDKWQIIADASESTLDIQTYSGGAWNSAISILAGTRDATFTGDIIVDSDSDGLVLGDLQASRIYVDGSDLIVNSLNTIANDEVHFTNFDAYVFDDDIQIDSDTDGLILGGGQDIIMYFDGSDLIINSLNVTANDEIHFTNFDFYVFDNPVMITNYKSGATQVLAGAAANELWVTNGHATQEDNTVMMGV